MLQLISAYSWPWQGGEPPRQVYLRSWWLKGGDGPRDSDDVQLVGPDADQWREGSEGALLSVHAELDWGKPFTDSLEVLLENRRLFSRGRSGDVRIGPFRGTDLSDATAPFAGTAGLAVRVQEAYGGGIEEALAQPFGVFVLSDDLVLTVQRRGALTHLYEGQKWRKSRHYKSYRSIIERERGWPPPRPLDPVPKHTWAEWGTAGFGSAELVREQLLLANADEAVAGAHRLAAAAASTERDLLAAMPTVAKGRTTENELIEDAIRRGVLDRETVNIGSVETDLEEFVALADTALELSDEVGRCKARLRSSRAGPPELHADLARLAEAAVEAYAAARLEVRAAGDAMASVAAVRQTMLAGLQQQATDQLQRGVSLVSALVLAPGVVAAIYGANVRQPERGTATGLVVLLLLMAATASGSLWIIRGFFNKPRVVPAERWQLALAGLAVAAVATAALIIAS